MGRIIFVIAAALLLSGCGAASEREIVAVGPMVSQSHRSADFNIRALDIDGLFDVTWQQSDDYYIKIEVQQNLTDVLEWAITEAGTLTVRFSQNVTVGNRAYTPRVYVSSPYLTAAHFGGAVSASGWDTVRAHEFSVSVSGASSAYIDLEIESLTVDADGAGRLVFTGSSTIASITAAGAVSVLADGLQVKDARIYATDTASVSVAASEHLDVQISSAAFVRYAGDPEVRSNISGAGSLSRIE